MNQDKFAQFLGFTNWSSLLDASQPIMTVSSQKTWYVVNTATWYKWVVWDNQRFRVLFNNTTREHALSQLMSELRKDDLWQSRWQAEEVSVQSLGSVG